MSILIAPNEDPRHKWPPFHGPLASIPHGMAEVIATFGNPSRPDGTGPEPVWTGRNIVTRHGESALPGVPPHWYFECHRLALPYFEEAFRRAEVMCPGHVKRAGCFVYRHQRDDPKRPLSYHSWGIAVDVNAEDNPAWYVDDPPEPWSDAWMAKFPRGLPREFVEAFESVGFEWGGRWKGFNDSQHFQICR